MKKIMLATDGSTVAEQAARFLAHLPHDEKIELYIVTALHVPGAHKTYLAGDWIETCMAQERKTAADSFARIEEIFEGANVACNHIVREGYPGETIVAIAREVEPELLVIGATGHSAIARVLLGSTSDYIATHAPCSVLVVRPSDGLSRTHRLRVAIAYEESGPAQAALEEFSEFGWAGQTDVRVLSVFHKPGFYDLPYDDPSPESVDKAVDQLRDVAPHVTGELISCDHIGEGLVRYIQSNDVDLVVVGETPRTRLGRVLMGSKTRFVLRHAPCSVWVTRNRMIHGTRKQSSQTETATT
ncbi:Nucleotide-binding universal stress protein, UspA family [Neorhodopirellula lusitana]|uniref:Nucleotide-binding universal stress protein, UspA family n=1 Tax=Neorhodopirellula lusitana TaxID=445327 RepID=A0ABY1PQX3_9BACT|nr:universal stress protein [Neorhodopirellula lusitana]SMP42772.1 Nucleotide-binding universal stress protein, UspA family [Neorhodopirellula lusitana]